MATPVFQPNEAPEALRAENAELRAELESQWMSNHFEWCGREWPHPPGYGCDWPRPEVLGAWVESPTPDLEPTPEGRRFFDRDAQKKWYVHAGQWVSDDRTLDEVLADRERARIQGVPYETA